MRQLVLLRFYFVGMILISGIVQTRAETVFGVIGDWGTSGSPATNVADMITDTDWNTDYIIALGDNNYGQTEVGSADWESRIGARFGDYIRQRVGPTPTPYSSQTSNFQRFFPTVGNHEKTNDGSISGYVDYFHTDPDNPSGRLPAGVHDSTQSYYDVELPINGGSGTIKLFTLDSEAFSADHISRSAQEAWLKHGLENSAATWNFVFFHRPAFSSGPHGSDPLFQLPFQRWGAHAVLAGHDHTYERLRVTDDTQNDMLYFVNGLGGPPSFYSFGSPEQGSDYRLAFNSGASRISVSDQQATFEFLSVNDGASGANGGLVLDAITLDQSDLPSPPAYADFDDSSIVDEQDLVAWRSEFGLSLAGDADFDGDTDGTDFLHWQRQFVGDEVLDNLQSIPEPSTGTLLVLLAVFSSLCQTRRNCCL